MFKKIMTILFRSSKYNSKNYLTESQWQTLLAYEYVETWQFPGWQNNVAEYRRLIELKYKPLKWYRKLYIWVVDTFYLIKQEYILSKVLKPTVW